MNHSNIRIIFACASFVILFVDTGTVPDGGVPDMTRLTVLNEEVINKNLKVRYNQDRIYVSFF